MEIKFKKLREDAVLPTYAKPGDAGMDLVSPDAVLLRTGQVTIVPVGLAVEIPEGYVGLVHPRSGLAAKHGITVVNTPGTIDAGYRGEIKVIMTMLTANIWATGDMGASSRTLEAGTRIAQLVIQKVENATPVLVDELSDSQRGEGGFGSTGYGTITKADHNDWRHIN